MNSCAQFWVTLALTFTLTPLKNEGASTQGTVYKRRARVKLLDPKELTLNRTAHGGGRAACVLQCSTHEECSGVNFRVSDGHCVGVGSSVYDFGKFIVGADQHWENFSPYANEVRDGDWILVFRAQQIMNTSAVGKLLEAWDNDDIRSDDHLDSVHPECYSRLKRGCDTFFRSKLLSDWPSDVDKVRIALYSDGDMAAEVVFDGRGSTRDNWFDNGKIQNSTWTDDLVPGDPGNIVEMRGQQLNDPRVFVMTTTADRDNCTQMGWLLVMNNFSNECEFEFDTTVIEFSMAVPQFLYSTTTRMTNFRAEPYGLAEVMAVFIKRL